MARAETRPAGSGAEGTRPRQSGQRHQNMAGDVRRVSTPIYFPPTQCAGLTTKDGAACTARPVKGEELCIGHLRSASGKS